MLSLEQFVELIGLTNCKLPADQRYTELSWNEKFDHLVRISRLSIPGDPVQHYSAPVWDMIADKEVEFQNECNQRRNLGKRARPAKVSYETASSIAIASKITSMRQWFDIYAQRFKPLKLAIPAYPSNIYPEWEGWGTFLGTQRKATHHAREGWLSYEEAKKEVRNWRVTSSREYQRFVSSTFGDPRLPIRPDHVYADEGWTSWSDFLMPRFVDYNTAKELMKPLGLRTEGDFRKLGKKGRPMGVPSSPYQFYPEFESWADFLGYDGPIDYQKRKSR